MVESTLWGSQDCCHIVLFFKGIIFELQSCHYHEEFSQFFAYYGKSKPKEVKCQKNYTFSDVMLWCDVKIYMCKENVHHNVLKNAKNDWNVFKSLWNLQYILTLRFCMIEISLWAMWKKWLLSYQK